MKKFTAILLTILMVMGCCSVMAVSAATTDQVASITVNGTAYPATVGKTITYSVDLKVADRINNGEFAVNYPQSIINITDVDFPVIGKGNVTYNYTENRVNQLSFNYSNLEGYDFSNGGCLVTVTFTVVAAGAGDISLYKEAMAHVDEEYLIHDELDKATFTESLTGYDEPKPETTISAKAAKSTIYVGATTTVKATVKNGDGATTFKTSDKKVATVSSKGVVKGVKAGSVKITATNNGKSAKVTIKVVKKANPMKVTGKTVSVSAKKNTVIKGSKAIVVKSAKGTVTYKKTKGDKKITITKNGAKITVKKGLKKGKTYKVTVKVTAAGTTAYKAASKTVTFKVKVK